jgi:hypothetical protein
MAIVRRRGSGDFNVNDALQLIVLATGNVLACLLQPAQGLEWRLGRVAMMNLIPLFLGSRTNVFVEILLGLSPHWRGLMYRWLGRMFLVEAVAHSLLHLAANKWQFSLIEILVRLLWRLFKLLANRRIKLLLSAITILVISLLYIWRAFYEFFLKLHFLGALGLNVLLSCHIKIGKNIGTIALFIATLL